MVDSVGFVNAVSGAPAYNGRMLRQLNAVGFAGATAARPLGARSGVRPGTSATTVTATSTTWTCQPFAGLCDGQVAGEAGPYPFAFDAVETGAVTAANGSNPRIDIIYVDVDDPSEDASSVPLVTRKYLAGVAAPAGTQVAPSAPAGCMTVAHINVPKSGGGSPTVTWVAPYCAAAGGVVYFNAKAEMDLWTTAAPNQRASVLADGGEYARRSGGWERTGPILSGRAIRTASSASFGTSWTDLSANAHWSTAAPEGQVAGFGAYNNGWVAPIAGVYRVGYELVVTGASFFAGVTVNKATSVAYQDARLVSASPVASGLAACTASGEMYLASGDVVRLMAFSAGGTGAVSTTNGRFTITWVRDA